jgi:hypothetical protein
VPLPQAANAGESRDPCGRVVFRPVIDHDYLSIRPGLSFYVLDSFDNQFAGVPCRDNY